MRYRLNLSYENYDSFRDFVSGEGVFQTIATALDKDDVRQQVMNAYHQRLEEFKANMGDSPPTVSLIRIYPNSINLYLRDSFPSTVLQDAGLSRPPAQNLSATEALQAFDNPIQVSISHELLSQADADVMFVWTAENAEEANLEAQKKISGTGKQSALASIACGSSQQGLFCPSILAGKWPDRSQSDSR